LVQRSPKRARSGSVVRTGLQAALAFLLAVLGAEAFVRITGLADHLVTDPVFVAASTPNMRYHFKPDLHARTQGRTDLVTNSLGFRDVEHTPTPAPNTVRLVFAGDSFTYGYGVPFDRTYPQLLQAKLSQAVEPARVEVLNFAVPGYDVSDEVGSFLDIASAMHPQIAILAIISDDLNLVRAGNFVDAKGYLTKGVGGANPIKSYLRRSRLALLLKEAYLRGIYQHTSRYAGQNVTAANVEGRLAQLDHALGRFLARCDEEGIRPVFAVLDTWESPASRAIVEHVRETRPDLPVVDCSRELAKSPRKKIVDKQTGHPNIRGHEILAQTLAPVLLPLVRECAAR
jgi:lysophospholipase L1-like esterase